MTVEAKAGGGWVFEPGPRPGVPVEGRAERFPVHRIYCVGQNYAEHAREMGSSGREPPVFFDKPADTDDLCDLIVVAAGRAELKVCQINARVLNNDPGCIASQVYEPLPHAPTYREEKVTAGKYVAIKSRAVFNVLGYVESAYGG